MHRLLTVLLLVLWITPTLAQDTALPPSDDTCTAADYLALIEAADLPNAPDIDAAILTLTADLAALRAACSGLSWTSSTEGLNAVLGPVTLSPGVYIATTTSDDLFSAQATTISGDCGYGIMAFFPAYFGAVDGARDSVSIENECTVIFDVTALGEWEFFLQPIQ